MTPPATPTLTAHAPTAHALTAHAPPRQHPPPLPWPGRGPEVRPSQPTLFAVGLLDPPTATRAAAEPPDGPGEPPGSVPDAAATAAALVRLVLESLAGRRPAGQLSRWFSEEVLAQLVVQRGLRRRSGRALDLALYSVRVQHPSPGVAEVSVHLRGRSRACAWALRMEVTREHWLCTALELGPRPVR